MLGSLFRRRRGFLFVVSFQFVDVGQQFFFARKATEVEADHLVGAQRRLATGPQADQEAGDDRAVRLNLDAIFVVAQQVPTAENLLEEPKKYFDRPPPGKYQTDDFGGYVE